MNHLDIIILAFVAYGVYRGFKNGFVMEVATLVGLILGIYLAILASEIVGLIVKGMVDWNPLPLQVIAFVIVFAIVTFSLKFIAILVEKVFKIFLVNFINKLAGLFLGALKFALIAGIVLLLIGTTGTKLLPEKTRTESLVFLPVTKLVSLVIPQKEYLGKKLFNPAPEDE